MIDDIHEASKGAVSGSDVVPEAGNWTHGGSVGSEGVTWLKKERDSPRSATTTRTRTSSRPGVAFCPGCTLELNLRFVSRVLGKDIIFVGTPSARPRCCTARTPPPGTDTPTTPAP